MGEQDVLIVRVLVVFFISCALASTARAQDEENDGVRRPERLTVGVADQFLGQLAPDRKTLYFASNRNTTNEIYSQNVEDGRAHILFDEGAEVTWPRVSPDGKLLLYISYSDRASGQLCVRRLPAGDQRRCLEDPAASLIAEWIDAKRIVLVARATLDGNLHIQNVNVESRLTSQLIVERNATSPAVSPDGRWLVYVPIERSSGRVGPAFAAHASLRLEAMSLEHVGEPVRITLDVPGLTAQPVFAKDGKSLYFVQFFTDSNHDGVVDAADHGVLFRSSIVFGDGGPVLGPPRQITDDSWNCQYPAPADDRLLSTCSRGRNLDLYSLPLDGEVPSDWTKERLALEVELASSRPKQQLLYHERLLRAETPDAKRFAMVRLLRAHLEAEAFAAAEFYAKHIAALDDPASAALARPLLALVEHRKAIRERERGRIVESFVEKARERMDALKIGPNEATASAAMIRIVRSEIADSIGDKTLARRELEAAPVAEKTPRSVIESYYERADALYRELDDRDALVAACRRLALDEHLPVDDRLRYARAAVRAVVRGLPFAEADEKLAHETAPADSELAFAIELGRAVLAIRDDHPAPAVRTALVDLFEKEKRADRRRTVVLDAVERATRFGADPVVERLAEHYVDSVGSGSEERRRAERLYTQVIVGRAFRRRAAEKLPEARADFEAVAKRTGSLEAVVGAVDLRLRAGETPLAIRTEYEARGGALAHFVTAYTLSRELPKLEGEAHGTAAAQAIAALTLSWAELKKQGIAQALYGAVQHEEYLRTNELGLAEKASTHYLVALELVGNNLRIKALVLGQLGLLHTQVGNYRIALGYLDDRDKLPYADNSEGFAVRLAKARALLHVGRERDAAKEADEALAMLEKAPKLAAYRVLALDRAALYHLAARQFDRALALYDEELPLVEADRSASGRRNQFVVHLSRAASAIGAEQAARANADLDVVDRTIADPNVSASLAWPHATNAQVVQSYRLVISGLRARASQQLNQPELAAKALETRRKLLEEGLAAADREEYVRQLTLVDAQLADNAAERHDAAGASAAIRRALDRTSALRDRDRGEVDTDQLDVLWLAAKLTASGAVPPNPDLPKKLDDAHAALATQPTAAFRSYQRWLEIYLTLTGPVTTEATAASTPGRPIPAP